MSEEEKKEIQEVYAKFAKEGLKERDGMTQEEEKKYSEKKEKEIIKELEKIKKKYSSTQD